MEDLFALCGIDEQSQDDERLASVPAECANLLEWRKLRNPTTPLRDMSPREVDALLCHCGGGPEKEAVHRAEMLVNAAVRDRTRSERDQVRRLTSTAVELLVEGIALETRYELRSRHPRTWRERLTSPDSTQVRDRRNEFRRAVDGDLASAVSALMAASGSRSNGLGSAHQLFLNCLIDQLMEVRDSLIRFTEEIGAEGNRPSTEELTTYRRIKDLKHRLGLAVALFESLREKEGQLTEEINRISRIRPRGQTEREAIDSLREQRDNVRAAKRTSRREKLRLRAEIFELRAHPDRVIGLEERVDRYFEQSRNPNNEAWAREAQRLRNEVLNTRLRIPRDTPLNEQDAWLAFDTYRRLVAEGAAIFSWQLIRKALFTGYAAANHWLDIGIAGRYSIGSYVGHGNFAYDVNTEAGQEVWVAVNNWIAFPHRLGLGRGRWLYQKNRSEVVRNRTRSGSSVQDAFCKIAYGIGMRSTRDVQGAMSEADRAAEQVLDAPDQHEGETAQERREADAGAAAADAMNNAESRSVIPATVGQNMDVTRIIAGLTYQNLVLNSAIPEAIQEERRQIVRDLDAELSRELGVSGPVLSSEVLADRGSFGFPHALAPEWRRGDNFRNAQRALQRILQRRDWIARLWAFLWTLLDSGVLPHLKGPAVTVAHFFLEMERPNHRVRVEVFTTHLSDVTPAILRAASGNTPEERRILPGRTFGRVGSTGNARSPHNHVEIEVFRVDSGAFVGNLEFHHFFPARLRVNCSSTRGSGHAAGQ